ncbi:hypothetical protein PsAD13_01385 [Pseudovibrio sp. Ad13]|uniref:hypothetical protein n=1 Tax=Pseudovibrio sp. Ad13 TaxID=989396 RepID=UPI0007AE4843|nr:hypothetical protein [Pseudovibrio sp. Ad13]KZK86250.1 hypothetical protein PsAD13_01385 [Pseudovibrio sp. Ad13]
MNKCPNLNSIQLWFVVVLVYAIFARIYPKPEYIVGEKMSELVPLSSWKPGKRAVIDVPEQGIYLELNGETEIINWLKSQLEKWDRLTRDLSFPEILQLSSHVMDYYHNAIAGKQFNNIGSLISSNCILLAENDVGRFVFDSEAAPRERLYYLCFHARVKFMSGPGQASDDFVRLLRQKFMDDWEPSFIGSSKETRASHSFTSYSYRRLEGRSSLKERELSSLTQEVEDAKKQYEAIKVQIRHREIELSELIAQRRIDLALEPASERWKRLARSHLLGATLGMLPFFLVILSAFFYRTEILHGLGGFLAPYEGATVTPLEQITKFAKEVPWGSFVLISAPVIFVAWVLRFFSRIFIQSYNQYNEAKSKEALTRVYAHMAASENGGLTDAQKLLVFDALFKPRIVDHKDDGSPISALEKISDKLKA